MPKLCICKICTCGRHKCPHNPAGIPYTEEPCTFSEYANQFQSYPLQVRKNYKPEHAVITNQAPLDANTTHRTDYVQHPLVEKTMARRELYKQPEGEMELTTNYHNEYTQKTLEPSRPIRPVEQHMSSRTGKFEGEPTYAADFKEWEIKPREILKMDRNVYQPSQVPFEATTNYQTEYLAKKLDPAKIVKPIEQVNESGPFEGDTHYRQDYILHAIPTRELKEKQLWKPNLEPFDDLSYYKKDFIAKSVGKSQSFKPNSVPYHSQSPFVGDTTQKLDYVPWPSIKKEIREKDVYKKPDGELDMNTTTKIDYVPLPIEKQLTYKPVEVRNSQEKFDGTTNYMQEYQKWTPTKEKCHKIKEVYIPSSSPFEGLATYQADYVHHQSLQPTKIVRPSSEHISYQGVMENATEYKNEFYRKEACPCPAALIEAGNGEKYRFSSCDNEGHRWFELLISPKKE